MKTQGCYRLLIAGLVLALFASGALAGTDASTEGDPRGIETGSGTRDTEAPVRILPLGDSITQGDKDHRSYRYSLWVRLIAAGISFDFVGSMNSNFFGNPVWPDYNGQSFDRDHEGHWGWQADQILNGHPLTEGKEYLSAWLEEYTPDIVLLHLGGKANPVVRNQSFPASLGIARKVKMPVC